MSENEAASISGIFTMVNLVEIGVNDLIETARRMHPDPKVVTLAGFEEFSPNKIKNVQESIDMIRNTLKEASEQLSPHVYGQAKWSKEGEADTDR
ncbi:MAG: hypothetical protein ABJB95_08245 [Gemmatimonadales bacterium]